MSRAFVMTMQRPHETLGIPMPLGRKLSELGKNMWVVLFVALTIVCFGVYIYQVNTTSAKGYALRALEVKQESLQENVIALEDKTAGLQTMQALQTRVQSLGFVPVDRIEFLDGNKSGYAMAK